MGDINHDSVFYGNLQSDSLAAAFIHSHFWGGTPAVGDKFTFSADPRSRIVEMPVLFSDQFTAGQASAYTINHVNSIVSDNRVVTGDSLGPEVDYDGTGKKSILNEYVRSMFEIAGFNSNNVKFADAASYHEGCGLVHCGTNALRQIPAYDWWEANP